MISVRLAGWQDAGQTADCLYMWQKLLTLRFLNAINMINIKLCMLIALIELYSFIPLSVILIVFKGHDSVRQFSLKIVYSYLIKFKL